MGKNRLFQMASEGLELPADILQGASHIDLLGREHLRIINHRGIAVYKPERILLRLNEGILSVAGNSLAISCLDDEQLTIEGHIDSITFGEAAYEK